MQIEHKQLIEHGKTVIYLDIYLEDKSEFSKETLNDKNKIEANSLVVEIKKYIKENIKYVKDGIIILAVNGILIGAITLTPQNEIKSFVNNIYSEITHEVVLDNTQTDIDNLNSKSTNDNNNNNNIEKQTTNVTIQKNNINNEITKAPVKNNSTVAKKTNATNNNNSSFPTKAPSTPTAPSSTTSNTITKPEASTKVEDVKPQGTYIKLNTNGKIQEIELETYIIGVVAAEMPASFNIEALKAQSVAARTYAMKKASKGITLKNSTSDQVYKTTDQMKAMWGSSYSTYYNKIKNAVNSTKGLVLKYNGEYIDAQYSSMTNGKTELAENVWSYSRPYLQCVSSTWDTKVSNFQVTKSFTYEKLSSALGQTITKDTTIQIISKTISDRVAKIQIGSKTYSGTNLRSLLGLRSTDFTIKLNNTNVEITTKGFGHGVGMSQYGAHIAANEGYTYKQILNHYYVGTSIVKI